MLVEKAHVVQVARMLAIERGAYDARMRGIRIALDEGDDALPIKAWAPRDPNYSGTFADERYRIARTGFSTVIA